MIGNPTAIAILDRLGRALAPPALDLRQFLVGSAGAGWIDAQRAARLAGFAEVFVVDADTVSFRPALDDEASRSAAMATVAASLAAEGALTPWRNELYAVAPAFGAAPWFRLERAAARYFGIHTWAAHVNGVVRGAPEARMWFARRSADKAIDPGMLDNLVGGGIAAGVTLRATLVKEAWEEAGISDDQAARALPAGVVHIRRQQPDGLQSETIFVHDLWLPEDFVPQNQDGEAVEHRRVTLAEAARLIAQPDGPDAVTADASLVVLDFLLRHGAIDPASPACAGLAALRSTQAAARLA
ncbi:MAG TPA: DUF4743 domain-containing protein [Casimicrobiaceae bacterium]|nr:DUF4743 domain-containing protein [Casimicrobiaceae bacterium]